MTADLQGDYVRRVDHTDEVDRVILRQVYRWAARDPAIYLEGSGYKSDEDFLNPPSCSLEYFVFIDDRPAALVTLIRLGTFRKVYQVGLVTDPDASLRKICRLLRGFMGRVYEVMADALFVETPDRPEYAPTRKLAAFFGFTPISKTAFILQKVDHGITQQ
jgi:hypothetical protein